jgi:predicted Zn-dependent protease
MCEVTSFCLSRRISRRRLLAGAAAMAVGAMAAPLVLNATAADAFSLFPLPSVDDQKKIGADAAKQVLQQYKLVNDSRTVELKAIGAKLVGALTEPDKSRWNYDFHLIDSKDVNAFALPGGPLFFFTGLYDNMTEEDELAGVVGHEMTHVRLQHWAHAYQKQQEREALLGVGLTVLHANSGEQTVASVYDQMTGLKYSRDEESQADHGGLQDMVAAGYNPRGMIDMFNVLLKKMGNGATLGSDFLSNHPLTTDRIKAAQDAINQFNAQQQFPPTRPIGSAAGSMGPTFGHPRVGPPAQTSTGQAQTSPTDQPDGGPKAR